MVFLFTIIIIIIYVILIYFISSAHNDVGELDPDRGKTNV
jgi:hypothetical protein